MVMEVTATEVTVMVMEVMATDTAVTAITTVITPIGTTTGTTATGTATATAVGGVAVGMAMEWVLVGDGRLVGMSGSATNDRREWLNHSARLRTLILLCRL
jgi:hypothetical protein